MKALILMTRVPVPGKTKTRLMDIFSGKECAGLHKSFLLDIFDVFEFIKNDVDVFLTYTPQKSFLLMEDYIPDYIECFTQQGKDLGEKMLNAFYYVFNKGYNKVVLIGGDVPQIQPSDINKGFTGLDNYDLTLGPTADGGYYLIGMKNVYRSLFEDKLTWGNKSVLEGTVDIANNLCLKIGFTNKLRDIDTKEDLLAFMNEIKSKKNNLKIVPKNTINYLNNIWSDKPYAERYFKV